MADGWSDANPSINNIDTANDSSWTHDSAEDTSLIANTGDQINLKKNALNVTLDQMYLGDLLLTHSTYGWTETTPATTFTTDGSRLRIADSNAWDYIKDTGGLDFAVGCTFVIKVRFDVWPTTSSRFIGILSATSNKREYVNVQKSGNDLVFSLAFSGGSWSYTNYFLTNPDIVVWITMSGSTSTVYIDGVQRLTGSTTATVGVSGFQLNQFSTASTDISIDWIKLYDGGAVDPLYSTSAKTSVAPQLDNSELTGNVSRWVSFDVTTSGVFTGGTTEVGWRTYNGSTWTSIVWSTITSSGQTITVDDNTNTSAIELSVRLTSTDGTAVPAGVDALSVNWSSDVTPPTNPTLKSFVLGGDILGLSAKWVEGIDETSLDHHEVAVRKGGPSGTWYNVVDTGHVEASGTVMKFVYQRGVQEAAGKRNTRHYTIVEDFAGNTVSVGDIYNIRVRAIDTESNSSSWVESSDVTIALDLPLVAPSLSAASTLQGSGAALTYVQSASADANQLVFKYAAEPSTAWSTQTSSGIATGVGGTANITGLDNNTMYRFVAYAQASAGDISPPSNPIRAFVSDGSSVAIKIAQSIASVASGLDSTVVYRSEFGEEINQFKPNLQQGPYCLVKTPMEIESVKVGAGWREVMYDVPVEVHYDDRSRIHANTAQKIATTFQNTFDHLPDALSVSDSRLISLDSLVVLMEAASSRRAPSLDKGVVGMRMRVGVHEKKTVT